MRLHSVFVLGLLCGCVQLWGCHATESYLHIRRHLAWSPDGVFRLEADLQAIEQNPALLKLYLIRNAVRHPKRPHAWLRPQSWLLRTDGLANTQRIADDFLARRTNAEAKLYQYAKVLYTQHVNTIRGVLAQPRRMDDLDPWFDWTQRPAKFLPPPEVKRMVPRLRSTTAPASRPSATPQRRADTRPTSHPQPRRYHGRSIPPYPNKAAYQKAQRRRLHQLVKLLTTLQWTKWPTKPRPFRGYVEALPPLPGVPKLWIRAARRREGGAIYIDHRKPRSSVAVSTRLPIQAQTQVLRTSCRPQWCVMELEQSAPKRTASRSTHLVVFPPRLAASRLMNRVGHHYHTRKQFRRAVEAFGRASQLDRSFGDGHYNKACALALLGRKKASILALQRAISLNKLYKRLLCKDKDFDGLRKDPAWRRLFPCPKAKKKPRPTR